MLISISNLSFYTSVVCVKATDERTRQVWLLINYRNSSLSVKSLIFLYITWYYNIDYYIIFITCVLCLQGPVFLRVQSYPCHRQESRALTFGEERAHWQIPMNETNIICHVNAKDGIHTISIITAVRKPTEWIVGDFWHCFVNKKTELISFSLTQSCWFPHVSQL